MKKISSDELYVVKSYMASGGILEYRWFDTRYFKTLIRAEKYQKDNTGYRGSSMPRGNHVATDIEVYKLKRIIKGKRAKRLYKAREWYFEVKSGKFKVVWVKKNDKEKK